MLCCATSYSNAIACHKELNFLLSMSMNACYCVLRFCVCSSVKMVPSLYASASSSIIF